MLLSDSFYGSLNGSLDRLLSEPVGSIPTYNDFESPDTGHDPISMTASPVVVQWDRAKVQERPSTPEEQGPLPLTVPIFDVRGTLGNIRP